MTTKQKDALKEEIDRFWNQVWLAGKHRIAADHRNAVENMLKRILKIIE